MNIESRFLIAAVVLFYHQMARLASVADPEVIIIIKFKIHLGSLWILQMMIEQTGNCCLQLVLIHCVTSDSENLWVGVQHEHAALVLGHSS